jgi:hypothetical protein
MNNGHQKPLITVETLCERMRLAAVPNVGDMCRDLGVHLVELNNVLESMAARLADPDEVPQLQDIRQVLHGVLTWGAAIGFHWAKQEKPIITPKVN